MGPQELSFILVKMQNGAVILEDRLVVLIKQTTGWPYEPPIALLDIYPNELKI